jgi:hypothetical protein
MKCTICNHPHRRDIDLALLSRRHTFESLHLQFGVSVSALFRQKKHLQEKTDLARDRLNNTRRQGCLLKLTALLEHVQQAVRSAEVDGSLDRVIRGAYVASRIIQQIDRLEVSLELETVYRLISAPGFVSQDTLLPTDPRVIADLHRSVADFACQPCPEPLPEVSEDADDEDFAPNPEPALTADDYYPVEAFPETQNLQPATRQSTLAAHLEALRLIQQLNPALDLPTAADLAAAAQDPEIKRKITGKLPEKIALIIEKTMQIQEDIQCEKNLPKNSPNAPNPGLFAKLPPPHPMAETLDLQCVSLETRAGLAISSIAP